MPGIHEDEGCNKPHHIGRAKRDNNRKEGLVLEEHINREILFRGCLLDGLHSDENGRE